MSMTRAEDSLDWLEGLTGIALDEDGAAFTSEALLTLFERLPVAIAVTRGPDHVFVYANRRYKWLVQPLGGEVIGRPLADVHGDRVNPAIRHKRDAVFREGRAQTMRAVSFFLEDAVRRSLWDVTLIPVGDGTGAVKGLVAVGTEVTEQVEAARLAEARAAEARQAAEAAAYERERLSLAVEATKLGIWEWDVASNTVYWSPRQKEIFGVPPDETVTYEHWSTAIHPDDKDRIKQAVAELIDPRSQGKLAFTHRIVLPSGEVKWIGARGRMLYEDRDGARTAVRLLGTAVDITGRLNEEARLREALESKQMLLRELNHRVKNSLNLISSMLAIQQRSAGSAETKGALSDAASRIASVASLHEQLHKLEAAGTVDLVGYFADLCRGLEQSTGEHEVKFISSVPRLVVPNRCALALGLIANELVTNCLKHAYPTHRGVIRVTIAAGQGRATMRVEDDGVGLPKDFKKRRSSSTGFLIMENLARQLGGALATLPRDRGACFEVPFNLE
jgi:PAS domain S-box-containing protein